MSPNETVADAIREFAGYFVSQRRLDIRKLRLENSEDLRRSLYARVNAQPNRGIFIMTVFARGYGRYQDMRRRYDDPGGEEYREALEEWIQMKGIERFLKGKYRKKYVNTPEPKLLGAIAWGIMQKNAERSPRKRRWWNRGKTANIERFYAILIRDYSKAVLAEQARKIEGLTQ
jgi:hypothetical protein